MGRQGQPNQSSQPKPTRILWLGLIMGTWGGWYLGQAETSKALVFILLILGLTGQGKREDRMSNWEETSERLTSQQWWEWSAGMKCHKCGWRESCMCDPDPCIPDLTDWATVGILLGMIWDLNPRKYWGQKWWHSSNGMWALLQERMLATRNAIPGQIVAGWLMELKGE